MKKEFLVLYDYGTGGVWVIVHARSAQEVETKFQDLAVVSTRPPWMTDKMYSDLMTFDVDQPEGWITQHLRPD